MGLEARVDRRIDKKGPVPLYRPELGPCWIWTGSKTEKGYGRVRDGEKIVAVHRLVYELLVGPITKPQLDHLCRVRACCNPAHLEPVTNAENQLRGENANRSKTFCKNGHPFTPENVSLVHRTRGERVLTERSCRVCARLSEKNYKERRAARIEKVSNG